MNQSEIYCKGKSKRGKGAIPILKSEIEQAHEISKSRLEACRKLGISYATYVKYSKKYGLYDEFRIKTKNNHKTKKYTITDGRIPLQNILNGTHPTYNNNAFAKRLFKCNVKEEKCEICGYNEKRVDGKVPLMLAFKDGNKHNKSLENIEIVCYNCAHNYYGAHLGKKKKFDKYFAI